MPLNGVKNIVLVSSSHLALFCSSSPSPYRFDVYQSNARSLSHLNLLCLLLLALLCLPTHYC